VLTVPIALALRLKAAHDLAMAKCDTGYFCRVCEQYVEDITDSELYLRFVLREVPFEDLFDAPEAHISCVPEIAREITDPVFRRALPESFQLAPSSPERAARVTAAWQRLQGLIGSGLAVQEYPLPER
jgi:hypothetical protein